MTKMTKDELIFHDNYLYAAEQGNLDAVKKAIDEGVDVYYGYGFDHNALNRAVRYNQLHVAEYLLKLCFGTHPKLVGKALIWATCPKAIRLLAKYNPDCSVTNDGGLTPRDLFISFGEYNLQEAYDQCGLPIPPINKKLMKGAIDRCDLKQWSVIQNIKVAERCCTRLTDFDATSQEWGKRRNHKSV